MQSILKNYIIDTFSLQNKLTIVTQQYSLQSHVNVQATELRQRAV